MNGQAGGTEVASQVKECTWTWRWMDCEAKRGGGPSWLLVDSQLDHHGGRNGGYADFTQPALRVERVVGSCGLQLPGGGD